MTPQRRGRKRNYSRRSPRKNVTTKNLKNLKMDSETYKLRRQVMKYIYEAKEVCDLPRVDVRITDNYKTVLGRGRFSRKIIWIPRKGLDDKRYDLRKIVYHELAHAAYNAPHDKSDRLMKPVYDYRKDKKLTKLQAQNALKKLAKGRK